MPAPGLSLIDPEQSVPPGQEESEITVRFNMLDRVMDAVHVRRHDEAPEPTVYVWLQRQIRVVEHRADIQNHFIPKHEDRRRADQDHDRPLPGQGDQYLAGVKPERRHHIEIWIGMMDAVEAP